MSACKYCGKEIGWKKDGGKNIAINPDGSFHKGTCRGNSSVPATTNNGAAITGRITEYEGSNVHIGTKIVFVLPEYRNSFKEKYPVGTVVSATVDKGTCKSMDPLTGPNLEAFLKKEEGQKQQQPLPEAQPPAEQPAATTPEKPKDTPCTSPEATPAKKEDIWKSEFEEFKGVLSSVKRDGIPELLTYLEKETDFFVAPSSTKYHDAVPGGLLHHSLRVYHNLVILSKTFSEDYPAESLIIIGLLHDLCKTNFYTTSTRNVKKELPGGFFEWVKEPYIDIDDKFPLGHGEKSVIILQRYVKLTDLEIMGIRWHMMAYDDVRNSYAGNLAITNASDKYRIIPLMHIADLSASFLEVRKTGGVS